MTYLPMRLQISFLAWNLNSWKWHLGLRFDFGKKFTLKANTMNYENILITNLAILWLKALYLAHIIAQKKVWSCSSIKVIYLRYWSGIKRHTTQYIRLWWMYCLLLSGGIGNEMILDGSKVILMNEKQVVNNLWMFFYIYGWICACQCAHCLHRCGYSGLTEDT